MKKIPRKKIDERKFTLMGRPQPKERPRLFRGHAYTPKKTLDYERRLREEYANVHGDKLPFTGDVALDVSVFCNYKNHGDLDNYVKIVSDGLNGVAWADDKQVKELRAKLHVDKQQEPRVEVSIKPIGGVKT